jgi:hypothetical protein
VNGTATDALAQLQMKIFTEALRIAGWIEGKNIIIDPRSGVDPESAMRSPRTPEAHAGGDDHVLELVDLPAMLSKRLDGLHDEPFGSVRANRWTVCEARTLRAFLIAYVRCAS